MIFDSDQPDRLSWRHRPWHFWLPGITFLATALTLVLGVPAYWSFECRPPGEPPSDGAPGTAEGACRYEWGASVWTTTRTIPLSEIAAVRLSSYEDKDDDGRRHMHHQAVLRTQRDELVVGDATHDVVAARTRVMTIESFLSSPRAPGFRLEEDLRTVVRVVAGILVVLGVTMLLFPHRASCSLDRKAGTLTTVHSRLFRTRRTVRPLGDLVRVGLVEARPGSFTDRHRICAALKEGAPIPLARQVRRRDILEPVVFELRKFLGHEPDEDPNLVGRKRG